MLGAAFAWACLLVATGLANRFVLPLALAVFAYFNLVLAATLPRSWWALALFGIMVVAILGGETRAAAGIGFAGLLALGAWKLFETRLVARTVPGQAGPVLLPALWRDATATGGGASWLGPLQGTSAPLLQLTTRPGDGGSLQAVLQAAANERARELSGFTMAGLEKWDSFVPGTLALEFQFEQPVQGAAVPMMGTLAVARAGPDTVVLFTVVYELGDRDRRWDTLRALRHWTR
jgi:hypothetical protein